ncbi:MAG: ferredoxin reductase family protein [Solirubrobacterales bacterium]
MRKNIRYLGPSLIIGLVVALAVLWIVARPTGEPTGSYVGQFLGAESVLLLSIGLVLVSTLPWVDSYFDGMDRAAIWHRRVAITGIVLLLPHVLLSQGSGPAPEVLGNDSWAGPAGVIALVGLVILAVWAILPRWRSIVPGFAQRPIAAIHDLPPSQFISRLVNNYEIWRGVHRTTGIFVAIAVAHGLGDATLFSAAPVLRWSFITIGVVGLAFYLYRELFARRSHRLRDYQVSEVKTVGKGWTEIVLSPLGPPINHGAGQFVMLSLESKTGWERHPFTLASSPSESDIRLTIRALGDYTSGLSEGLQPGMPAVLGGPYGRFRHSKGTRRQVWVAGGVGVTPFLSWIRSLDEDPLQGPVEFFYTVPDEAPYSEEIAAIADPHSDLAFHLVRSDADGYLTVDDLLEALGGDVDDVSVFMCGPKSMVHVFREGLMTAGVPGHLIFHEYFDWR